MSLSKMLQAAQGEVGYLEKKSNSQLDSKTANAGRNNYTKYGAWYDGGSLQGQAWCDMFVSWCAAQAGEGSAVGCYAYCPSHVNFFKAKGQYFARGTKKPQAGDIIFFTTSGSRACNVGIVESVSGSKVTTIEGNTSGASTLVSNGGGVCRKTYALTSTYILGYGRPAYSGGSSTATPAVQKTTKIFSSPKTYKNGSTEEIGPSFALLLDADGQAHADAPFIQRVPDQVIALGGGGQVHQHIHHKESVHDGLVDVQDVDLQVRQLRTDPGDDAYGVAARDGYDCSHSCSS